MSYFKKMLLVKCIEATHPDLKVEETYTVYQEIGPKIGEPLYTVCMNGYSIEHVPANSFELVPMKKVQYKGGWGSPHFACCWGEIHSPLKQGEIYEVMSVEKLQTPGLPEYIYELRMPNGDIEPYANSVHFEEIK